MSANKDKIINILKDCEVEEKDINSLDFIASGILESLQIAEIVMSLEDEFKIEIDGEDIIPENFQNVEQLEKLVRKYTDEYSYDAGENKHASTDEVMWDMVARNAENPIEQSGWKSSFTGTYFSEIEMDEFTENVRIKIAPYIDANSTVIEIGVGSGLIAEKIAPYVKEYIGVDISKETIEKSQRTMREKCISNITFIQGNALELSKLKINKADVIIINSVVQYFNDYEEYQKVMRQAVQFVDKGIIFVGDILDMDKKSTFMEEIKKCNAHANMKDLWYSRNQILDLKNRIEAIKEVYISDKSGYTIQNELTQYRFDAIYEV